MDATHAEVGAYLLGLWGLQDPILEAVAYHHSPMGSVDGAFSPLTAVHVANVLAKQATSKGGSRIAPKLDTGYLEELGVGAHVRAWQGLTQKIEDSR